MNLLTKQVYGNKAVVGFNTYIGGVSATISTASALATKLSISVGRIENFTIVGSDIKCRITGSYAISSGTFENRTDITSYYDYDGLVTSIGSQAFNFCSNVNFLWFPNCTSVANSASLGVIGVYTTIYIPRCTSMGSTAAINAVFGGTPHRAKLYCPVSLQTNNSGSPDGDVVDFISFGGAVSYVSNFTAPNSISDLTAGTIYNTAIQLNFTPPSSTNTIEFYECYADGVLKNTITESGQYIIGLTPNTPQNITLKSVDIFYNKSIVSNNLIITTTLDLSDTDATAYTTASSNGAYQYGINDVFKMLKDRSIYAKTQLFYPFLGTTSAQHKWNAKNPVDTNAAFRLTFTGAATFSNLGYQLNGSSYANTYFIPSVNQNINSNGFTFVVGTNNAANSVDTYEVGVINGSQYSFATSKRNNTDYGTRARVNNGLLERLGINESRGITTAVRQDSTVSKLIKNGSVIDTDSAGGGSLPTIAIFIGGLNLNGGIYGQSNQRIQSLIIHEGLSDVETATLHIIINAFETSLGRKTW